MTNFNFLIFFLYHKDDIIKNEKPTNFITGGCTAIVTLLIFNYIYVANAGDSRAIICQGKSFHPMSKDLTPEVENVRIRQLAQMRPDLLGKKKLELKFYIDIKNHCEQFNFFHLKNFCFFCKIYIYVTGNEYTYLRYSTPPTSDNLGKRILYRDAFMSGMAYKTIDLNDLKTPIVSGEGKKV